MRTVLRMAAHSVGPLCATGVYGYLAQSYASQIGLATVISVGTAAVAGAAAHYLFLDFPLRFSPVRRAIFAEAVFEGHWKVNARFSDRPHAYIRVFFDRSTGRYLLEGFAFDDNWEPQAQWVSTQLTVDRSRCTLSCSYYASFFRDPRSQFAGLTVVEYFATESGTVRFAEGYFVDGGDQPLRISERLERISVPYEIGSPEEARVVLQQQS